MGRIVVSENVSLDGVMEDPTGEEGSKHGGWFLQFLNGDRDAWAEFGLAQALAASALLLGRRSDDYFGSRWNTREGAWAEALNNLPKYVVSSTVQEPVGQLDGCDGRRGERGVEAEGGAGRRDRLPREPSAGADAGQHDLVDEVRLLVYPTVLGAGKRLFGETSEKTSLLRLKSRTVGDGLAYLRYEVVRAA